MVKEERNSINTTGVGLTVSQLQLVFPYSIAIDANFQIIQFGNKLMDILEYQSLLGNHIYDSFETRTPFGCPWQWDKINKSKESTVDFTLKKSFMFLLKRNELKMVCLRGSILLHKDDGESSINGAIFLLHLNISNSNELNQIGYVLSDIPKFNMQKDLFLASEHLQSEFRASQELQIQHQDLKLKTLELESAKVKSILDSKKAFIRYISHELRNPLNISLLGLNLLEEQLNDCFQTSSSTTSTSKSNHQSTKQLQQQFNTPNTNQPSSKSINNNTTTSNNNNPSSSGKFSPIEKNILLELVSDIKNSNVMATEILNDLLLYEKIDNNELNLDMTEIKPSILIKNVIKLFSPQARQSNIHLDLKEEDQGQDDEEEHIHTDCPIRTHATTTSTTTLDNVLVQADISKLSQVLRNLLSNALKFTPSGGQVSVSTELLSYDEAKASRSHHSKNNSMKSNYTSNSIGTHTISSYNTMKTTNNKSCTYTATAMMAVNDNNQSRLKVLTDDLSLSNISSTINNNGTSSINNSHSTTTNNANNNRIVQIDNLMDSSIIERMNHTADSNTSSMIVSDTDVDHNPTVPTATTTTSNNNVNGNNTTTNTTTPIITTATTVVPMPVVFKPMRFTSLLPSILSKPRRTATSRTGAVGVPEENNHFLKNNNSNTMIMDKRCSMTGDSMNGGTGTTSGSVSSINSSSSSSSQLSSTQSNTNSSFHLSFSNKHFRNHHHHHDGNNDHNSNNNDNSSSSPTDTTVESYTNSNSITTTNSSSSSNTNESSTQCSSSVTPSSHSMNQSATTSTHHSTNHSTVHNSLSNSTTTSTSHSYSNSHSNTHSKSPPSSEPSSTVNTHPSNTPPMHSSSHNTSSKHSSNGSLEIDQLLTTTSNNNSSNHHHHSNSSEDEDDSFNYQDNNNNSHHHHNNNNGMIAMTPHTLASNSHSTNGNSNSKSSKGRARKQGSDRARARRCHRHNQDDDDDTDNIQTIDSAEKSSSSSSSFNRSINSDEDDELKKKKKNRDDNNSSKNNNNSDNLFNLKTQSIDTTQQQQTQQQWNKNLSSLLSSLTAKAFSHHRNIQSSSSLSVMKKSTTNVSQHSPPSSSSSSHSHSHSKGPSSSSPPSFHSSESPSASSPSSSSPTKTHHHSHLQQSSSSSTSSQSHSAINGNNDEYSNSHPDTHSLSYSNNNNNNSSSYNTSHPSVSHSHNSNNSGNSRSDSSNDENSRSSSSSHMLSSSQSQLQVSDHSTPTEGSSPSHANGSNNTSNNSSSNGIEHDMTSHNTKLKKNTINTTATAASSPYNVLNIFHTNSARIYPNPLTNDDDGDDDCRHHYHQKDCKNEIQRNNNNIEQSHLPVLYAALSSSSSLVVALPPVSSSRPSKIYINDHHDVNKPISNNGSKKSAVIINNATTANNTITTNTNNTITTTVSTKSSSKANNSSSKKAFMNTELVLPKLVLPAAPVFLSSPRSYEDADTNNEDSNDDDDDDEMMMMILKEEKNTMNKDNDINNTFNNTISSSKSNRSNKQSLYAQNVLISDHTSSSSHYVLSQTQSESSGNFLASRNVTPRITPRDSINSSSSKSKHSNGANSINHYTHNNNNNRNDIHQSLSSSKPPPDILRIYVKDTGIGLSKATQKALFEEFSNCRTTTSMSSRSIHNGTTTVNNTNTNTNANNLSIKKTTDFISANPNKAGSGLGLWVARSIMEAHRGTIGVFSEGAVDKGSVFYIDIPISKILPNNIPMVDTSFASGSSRNTSSKSFLNSDVSVNNSSNLSSHQIKHNIMTGCIVNSNNDNINNSVGVSFATNSQSSRSLFSSLSPRCLQSVLVVDDSKTNRKMLVRLLQGKKIGHIEEAVDGADAIEKYKNSISGADGAFPYDVIMMDFVMPVMDGATSTQLLRALGYKGLIVGVTGNSLPSDVELFLESGANKVMIKPLDITKFMTYASCWIQRCV